MKTITIENIVKACGGQYRGAQSALLQGIDKIVTDHRKAEAGALFIGIVGEKFDGNDYALGAAQNGASCLLVNRVLETDTPQIIVENTLLAMQDLAIWYREGFDIKVIAITGSAGKTTTKELIACVCSQAFDTLRTSGNFNNQIGVPLTLFNLDDHHQVAVIEMGTNHFGEIHALSRIARPDIAVITNIGQAHIEHFGSREGIYRGKKEIADYLKPGGSVIIDGDDPLLYGLTQERGDVTTYGLAAHNDYIATEIQSQGLAGTDFSVALSAGEHRFFVPSPGGHMIKNALAAIAVGEKLGISPDDIAAGLATYAPVGGRMRMETCGDITVLNDAYNANPDAVCAAIDVLAMAQGRTLAVLGDMGELGDQGPVLHARCGAYAAEKGIDLIAGVGPLSADTARAAAEAGGNAMHFAERAALEAALPDMICPGDTVLVKASHYMDLEPLVPVILALGEREK